MHSVHQLAYGMRVNLCLARVAPSGIFAALYPNASLVSCFTHQAFGIQKFNVFVVIEDLSEDLQRRATA